MGTSQEVRAGDLVFCLFDIPETPRTVGMSRHNGMITGAYTIFECFNSKLAEYMELFYRAMDDRKLLSPLYSGLRKTIPAERFLGTKTPQPPPAEQTAIVRFLDWANRRLERAIRAKLKVIVLLNEQKLAIIHRAVTRGLEPSVPLKPSGIPWLGDIPQHWEVLRAKHLYREVDERSTEGSEELLSVSHLTGVTPRSQKTITMFKAASYAGHKLCRPGDLVVNTMWAWMGALGVSTHAGIISPAYAVYRPHRPECIVGTYMDGLLRSRPYVSNIICRSTGLRASRLRLYPDEFFRLPIIQPPAEEQQRIVQAIQGETADLNTAINRLEREIELLREYRTRLVADVVTGKLDVREATAWLPEEAAPDTAEEPVDSNDDTEPTDEEAAA
jgi:type I restriction enzyme S subunit